MFEFSILKLFYALGVEILSATFLKMVNNVLSLNFEIFLCFGHGTINFPYAVDLN